MIQIWTLNDDGSKNTTIACGDDLNQALNDANLTVEEYNQHKHLLLVEEVDLAQITAENAMHYQDALDSYFYHVIYAYIGEEEHEKVLSLRKLEELLKKSDELEYIFYSNCY